MCVRSILSALIMYYFHFVITIGGNYSGGLV